MYAVFKCCMIPCQTLSALLLTSHVLFCDSGTLFACVLFRSVSFSSCNLAVVCCRVAKRRRRGAADPSGVCPILPCKQRARQRTIKQQDSLLKKMGEMSVTASRMTNTATTQPQPQPQPQPHQTPTSTDSTKTLSANKLRIYIYICLCVVQMNTCMNIICMTIIYDTCTGRMMARQRRLTICLCWWRHWLCRHSQKQRQSRNLKAAPIPMTVAYIVYTMMYWYITKCVVRMNTCMEHEYYYVYCLTRARTHCQFVFVDEDTDCVVKGKSRGEAEA